MSLATQTTSDLKGDRLSVKMFFNDDGSRVVDDFNKTTGAGTDNTTGIQAALNALKQGQRLFFPTGGTGCYLITSSLVFPRGAAGVKAITIEGAHKLHCQICYVGAASEACAFNLIGCDSITFAHITLMSWGNTHMPQATLMLGRYPNSDAYGHHTFSKCSVMGNALFANVYSICSEENAWRGVSFFLNNGKSNAGTANHNVYLSNLDDAGITSPTITADSNLDIWFQHCSFVNFGNVLSSSNDSVYVQQYAGSGDMVFRDCYFAPSKRGHEIGYAFRFMADPVNPYSGSNYVVEANRVENAEGLCYMAKGTGPGTITGLRFKNNTVGISAGYVFYGEDGAEISQSTWMNNFPPAVPGMVNISIDKCARLSVIEEFDGTFSVRTIASYSYFNISSPAATLSLGASSFGYIAVLFDRMIISNQVQTGALTVGGTCEVDAPYLGGVTLLVKDANGTTTGKVIEFRTFAGVPYFSVYGGTDAGFAGTVSTRDILPLANLNYVLGNAGLIWKEIWVRDLRLTGSTAHGVLIGQGGSPATCTAVGSAGQALTSNGAGVDPTFQDIPVPGAWTSFNPTVTPTGSMTWSATSHDCAYVQIGKIVFMRLNVVGTPGGTRNNAIQFSLPVSPSSSTQTLTTQISTAPAVSTLVGGVLTAVATATLPASSTSITIQGSYEAA